jgi:chromosome condensin MukBEF ATPase and DNA-binding subunit MukB
VEQELVGVELERDQLRNKLFYAEHDASELREFVRVNAKSAGNQLSY